MSKKKEFDKFTGKPYDQLHDGVGYEKDFSDRNKNGIKDTKELQKEVNVPINKINMTINISDWSNMFLGIFFDFAVKKLDASQQAISLSIRSILAIAGFLIILFGAIYALGGF